MAASNTDESWPPKSARQALLSSPSGRKKYADFRAEKSLSPTKREPGTPSLLDRLRLARNNQDHKITRSDEEVKEQDEDEDEDDEETLQLKLAAIEAKLKLKKLQNKAKREDDLLSRPASAAEAAPQVEVPLSPVRRPQAFTEQKSPNRVRLGIDKGITGADISLRRATTVNGSPTKDRQRQQSGNTSRQSCHASATNNTNSTARPQIKSFSERMAETRDKDKKQVEQREIASSARSKGFQLDKQEIEDFKAATERSSRPADHPILSSKNQGDAALFEGFSGLHLSTRILPHSFLKRTLPKDRYTIYRIPDLLKNVTSPAYEVPDEVCDFVIFGVIASKSNPFDQKSRTKDNIKTSNERDKKWEDGSQNKKKFMAFTLTDLKWTIELYLFGTALPRYHRLTTGMVVAILNPSIMPPRKGREDTGAFSLALHNDEDTILEIGTSQHLGYCNVVKKDGKQCGQWIDSTKTEICEWHLNTQINKMQSKRMGVNTGSNGFGGERRQNGNNAFGPWKRKDQPPATSGRGFDRESSSQYYFVSSSDSATRTAPVYNPDISTARMLDIDDDPFIAEGQFVRGKEALLAKRLAAQEKERKIANKLANLGDGSSAGADYLRRKTDSDTTMKSRNPQCHDLGRRPGRSNVASSSRPNTAASVARDFKAEISRKRAAEDVRLSPIKKTRFLTYRGIREAGKESVGTGTYLDNHRPNKDDDDDDDDDLDII